MHNGEQQEFKLTPNQIPILEHMTMTPTKRTMTTGHVAWNLISLANKVSRGSKCLTNELLFLDTPSCKRYFNLWFALSKL